MARRQSTARKSTEADGVAAAETAAAGPIPVGTKRVVNTRREVFDEPLHLAPAEETDDDERDEVSTDRVTVEEPDFDDETPEPTPFDRFLQSLESEEDVVIHVRRKPDPPNQNFKNPYSGPTITVGEIPFEETFDSATSVDLAVQRMYGGGYYLLEFKQSGRYKTAKSRLIADPPANVAQNDKEPKVAAVSAPERTAAAPDDVIDAFTKEVTRVKNLKALLRDDEVDKLREELEELRRAKPAPPPASISPDNQYALLHSVLSSPNPDNVLATKILERVMPEESQTTWMGDLLAHPQEAMTLLQVLLDRLDRWFGNRGTPSNMNGGNGLALPPVPSPPSLNQLLPPPIVSVLEIIGEDVMNFEPAENDDEISASVYRAADAILDATEAAPQLGQMFDQLFSDSPVEIVKLVSGQKGIQQQGIEQLRVVGYEYIAKKKDADMYFRELKQAVKTGFEEREARKSEPPPPGGNANTGTVGVSPAPAS